MNAPVVQINEEYFEDLDYSSMSEILVKLKKDQPIKKGSQIDRQSSEPIQKEKND